MKLGPESIEQIIVMDWVRKEKLDDFIFHCANERKISPQGGALLKRMGVLPGVSDIIIADKGKLSPAQSKFLEKMNAHGYFAVCRFGHKEAIATIKDYLGMS